MKKTYTTDLKATQANINAFTQYVLDAICVDDGSEEEHAKVFTVRGSIALEIDLTEEQEEEFFNTLDGWFGITDNEYDKDDELANGIADIVLNRNFYN